MRSIRGQMTRALLAGLFALFAVCGVSLFLYVRHALLSQFDEGLLAKARTFAAMSEQDEEGEEEDEREVSLRNLPTGAQEAIKKSAAGGFVNGVEQDSRDGAPVYNVEIVRNGIGAEFAVSTAGEYLGIGTEFDFEFSEAALPEFQPSSNAEYYQVWDEDGEAVAKSPSLEKANLER